MKYKHVCTYINDSPSCLSIKNNTCPDRKACLTYSAHNDPNDPMEHWLNTGTYHTSSIVGQVSDSQPYIAYFNKCSLLPLVCVVIHGFTLAATVDTGAVRTLLSSSLIQQLFPDFLSQLCKDKVFNLKDVNNNSVIVLGYLPLSFSIGQCHFTHDFLVFESQVHELLLGLDFLKLHKIAISPNIGLLFESQLVHKVNNFRSTSYIVTSTQKHQFPPHSQTVIKVVVNPHSDTSDHLDI